MKFDTIGTYRKQKTNQQGGKKNEQKICQHAQSRRNLHTHTHTHTDSFLKSLKQIGTICLTFSFLIFPNFASADNIPTTNPGCTTTVLGAQNIANGSAALEPDFSANTINTTWYSNGTQLTGNNIPATCTYDDALTPPTPEARPGYAFNGWTLRVPAEPEPVVPSCSIPSTLASTSGTESGYRGYAEYVSNDYMFSLQEEQTWGVSWPNDDKVTGISLCSATSGTLYAVGNPDINFDDYEQNCWCRATRYTPDYGNECDFLSPLWVYLGDEGLDEGCKFNCARKCADYVLGNSDVRAAIFTGLVAQ